MIENYLSETKKLNQNDLSEVIGNKIYYSKNLNFLYLLFQLFFTLTFIILTIYINELSIYFLAFIFISFIVYLMNESLSFINFKNPIFIINNSNLYYSRTNRWYDIDKNSIEIVRGGRYNHILSFRLTNEKNQVEILEDLWRIKNNEILRKLKK